MRCSRNSDSAPKRSRRCDKPMRFEQALLGSASISTNPRFEDEPMNTMAQTDKMLSRKEGHVGDVIFNTPASRSAVSLEIWGATARILDDFGKNNEVRVALLTGAAD